jgi:hypothetical protein
MAIINQSHSEVRPETPHSASKTAPSAHIVVDAPEWRFLWPSELIKAEEVLRALGLILHGVIERIYLVIACTRRDPK